jgi:putative ABC transport system permease protein
MLKNYIIVAWRNLLKHRILSTINIVGLSLSISFCVLLILHINKESSFDNFHENRDKIFRLEMTNLFPSMKDEQNKSLFSFLTRTEDVDNQTSFPLIVGRDIKANFPEVNRIVRFQDIGIQLVKVNLQTFKQDHILYADNDFFKTFSFPIIKGKTFSSKNTVVLSNIMARKLFGDEDPIGKTVTLTIDTVQNFIVNGIVADAPDNSSIQIGMVLPLSADPGYQDNIDRRFNSSSHYLMLELKNGVSATLFENKLNNWMKTYFADYIKGFQGADIKNFHWYMRHLMDCHYMFTDNWGHYTDKKNLYQLACLVIIILLIASLNYVLLTISRATARSQEVGIRKVMGANRKAVVLQFWVETQVLVIISVILGLILSMILLPLFNRLLGTNILFRDFTYLQIAVSGIIIALVLGLFAGYYPAFILSRMPPVSVLKSFKTFKINPKFSTVLVILQYSVCVILMASAIIINRQMHFLNTRDLGFDKDQVLMVENPTFDFAFTRRVKDRFYTFSKTQPYIIQYSGMMSGLDGANNTNGFKLNGQQQWRKQLAVDYNYFEMLGLKFIEGRSFSRSFLTDTIRKNRPTIVNETLFRQLGKTARLGEFNEPLGETIIGVVRDYNFESLNNKIEPEDHVLAKDYVRHFMFKIRAGHTQEAITSIGEEWKNITGDYPFEFTFLDQSIAKMYETDMRWQNIIQAACFFAVFIACLGLFGLSSISAVNRFREIGIRKILGASVSEIVGTLSMKFMLWVTTAIIVAVPIAWLIMNNWLQAFAYRVELHWWIFAFIGLLALVIAFFTLSIQTIKAARANPVKSLKSE